MSSSSQDGDYMGAMLVRTMQHTQAYIINCEPIKACYYGASLYSSWGYRASSLIENYKRTLLSWLKSFDEKRNQADDGSAVLEIIRRSYS